MAEEAKDDSRFTDAHPVPHRLSDINRELHSKLIDCPIGKSFFWTDGRGAKISGRVQPHIRDLKIRGYIPDEAVFTTQQEAKDSQIGVRVWRVA